METSKLVMFLSPKNPYGINYEFEQALLKYFP